MKKYIKLLLHWAIVFLLCFITIYLMVFAGAWRLFESQDPIVMEIGCALILSIFFFAFYEVTNSLHSKIEKLEERIQQLEENIK